MKRALSLLRMELVIAGTRVQCSIDQEKGLIFYSKLVGILGFKHYYLALRNILIFIFIFGNVMCRL